MLFDEIKESYNYLLLVSHQVATPNPFRSRRASPKLNRIAYGCSMLIRGKNKGIFGDLSSHIVNWLRGFTSVLFVCPLSPQGANSTYLFGKMLLYVKHYLSERGFTARAR